jgi:hypothetical protein
MIPDPLDLTYTFLILGRDSKYDIIQRDTFSISRKCHPKDFNQMYDQIWEAVEAFANNTQWNSEVVQVEIRKKNIGGYYRFRDINSTVYIPEYEDL